ncbi:MAG: nuclear transport factor 2 family protein [Paucibacter sp.]|nr:nuclear transport factor 2 family protein [Roseateles sp.]
MKLRLAASLLTLVCSQPGASAATTPAPASASAPAPASASASTSAVTIPPEPELTRIVTELDRRHFGAFNSCDVPTIEALYAPDTEFYHDLSGRVLDRAQLMAAIRKNICGKVQRRLIEGSLEVSPLAGYGAIEQGRQCFFRVGESNCVQQGRFFMLWKFDGTQWQLTRVVSYEHKELPAPK